MKYTGTSADSALDPQQLHRKGLKHAIFMSKELHLKIPLSTKTWGHDMYLEIPGST